jgi:hypothetical protein
MDVLVTEAALGDARDVVEALNARGHHVHRCVTDEAETPLCMRFAADGDCPLDGPIAVTVDVRQRDRDRLTPLEYGAVCSLQRQIPVVLAGVREGSVVAGWAERVCAVDEAPAVAESAAQPAEVIRGRAVGHAVRHAWFSNGLPGPVDVEVVVDGPLPEVVVTAPELPHRSVEEIVRRAARSALRAHDEHASRAVVTYRTRGGN